MLCIALACDAAPDRNSTDAETGPVEWRLADRPRLSIGMLEGDERYQFVYVSSAWKHADDRIVVFDRGKQAILFYDTAGVFLAQVGRRGNGPGEFQRGGGGWPYRGDSIAVYDLEQQRLSILNREGKFVRSFQNPVRYTRKPGVIPSQSCCSIFHSFADGSFVARPPDDIPNGPGPDRFSTLTLVRVSADGIVLDTMRTVESVLYRHDPGKPNGISHYTGSFGFTYTTLGDELIGGQNQADGLIAIHSGSHHVDTIPLPGERRPFNAELQAEFEQALRDDYAARGSEARRYYEGSVESNLPDAYAPHVPRFVGIKSDTKGRLWLQQWSVRFGLLGAPQSFTVLSRAGKHLANLQLKPDSRLLWAGDRQVLTLDHDSLDVQYVRLYDVVYTTTAVNRQ
jgi:hypothetical protein